MINSFTGKYDFLSNFYATPIVFRGLTYQNSEAAFQAMKCVFPQLRVEFTRLDDPADAKWLGRRIKMRSDWEKIKVNVMYAVCKAKFDQNAVIREALLATGDEYLEEGNHHGDKCWGTVNGVGNNYLGKILMLIRKEYREGDSKIVDSED